MPASCCAAQTKHTPIITLTAHAITGDRERFLELGFDAYLSKPLRTDELFQQLQSVL